MVSHFWTHHYLAISQETPEMSLHLQAHQSQAMSWSETVWLCGFHQSIKKSIMLLHRERRIVSKYSLHTPKWNLLFIFLQNIYSRVFIQYNMSQSTILCMNYWKISENQYRKTFPSLIAGICHFSHVSYTNDDFFIP